MHRKHKGKKIKKLLESAKDLLRLGSLGWEGGFGLFLIFSLQHLLLGVQILECILKA